MLSDSLKILYGTTFVFFAKTFGFHHNVEGENFPQYHKFLDDMYVEIYESLDKIAEHIRTLGSYSPGSLQRMLELSMIKEQTKIPRAELMVEELLADNEKLLSMWKEAFSVAEQENEQGIANFIAERIDAHGKHGWMLRSILKKDRA